MAIDLLNVGGVPQHFSAGKVAIKYAAKTFWNTLLFSLPAALYSFISYKFSETKVDVDEKEMPGANAKEIWDSIMGGVAAVVSYKLVSGTNSFWGALLSGLRPPIVLAAIRGFVSLACFDQFLYTPADVIRIASLAEKEELTSAYSNSLRS